MKLAILSFLFRLTGAIVVVAGCGQRAADWLHQRVWSACTRENLKQCNERQVARTQF